MAIARPPLISAEEFLRLPDDGRKYELVNGEIREVPAGMRHDEYGARVIYLLYPHARGKGALCGSTAGYRMRSGNIRSPDASFTRSERLPGGRSPEGFGDGAPDLCVEIISATEDRAEASRKVSEYFEAGAEQVWHLFPVSRSAVVFTAPEKSITLLEDATITGGDILSDFRCRVGELFDIG